MKKIFFLFTILSLCKQNAISQHNYGLKAGLNLSNQVKAFYTFQSSTSHRQYTKPLFGYELGAFYKSTLNAKWAFSVEADFSLIGSKTPFLTEELILNGDSVPHYYTDKIGYIAVPITLQYNFNKLYFGFGPGIAFKVFYKIKNFENRTLNSTYLRNLDVVANLLTGYKISKKWDVNMRYSRGLLNIHEHRKYAKTRNSYFNLSMLYFFEMR